MTSKLAAIACVIFVVHLFRQDIKANPGQPRGLWIPLVWMFIAGSRWTSSWLNLSPPLDTVDAYSEGSPIDRAVFLGLITAGLIVLARRNIEWKRLLLGNKLLIFYLLYSLVSVTWSDEPFVAFKRWIKDLGNPIMVLIILTTPDPLRALASILRRFSFLMLPASVLFVKYYPDLGRVFHVDGTTMYTGIGHQKNDLGLMCLISGTYFCWQILQDRDTFRSWPAGVKLNTYLLAGMMAWLLYMSNSQTSLSCLLVSAGVILIGRLDFVRKKPSRLVGLIVSAALAYAVLEATYDLKNQILALLGRDPTLTNRTELWRLLFGIGTDPFFGAGFMSFWSGNRMAQIWAVLGTGVNQAHSGYIEQYLNLGYIGVSLIAFLLLSALLHIRAQLSSEPSMAVLRLCFVLSAILSNYTEASFYGISNMWLLLLAGMTTLPHLSFGTVPSEPRNQAGKNSKLPTPASLQSHQGSALRGDRSVRNNRYAGARHSPGRNRSRIFRV